MALDTYRREIAKITADIIRLIGEREKLAKKIALEKRKEGKTVFDYEAEEKIISLALELGRRLGVSDETVLKIVCTLINDSKKVQESVLGSVGISNEKITPISVATAAMELQRSGKEVYRLDVGEPDFNVPAKVMKACCDAIRQGRTHYTDPRGMPELITALASYVKSRYGYDAKHNQFVITPGGRFAVYASLASILKEGDSAIVIEPAWPMYKEALDYIGCRCITVGTRFEDRWEPSVEDIRKKIKEHTRAIILSYPNNPTGKIINRKKFKEIVELANSKNLTILSDEIYNDYSYIDCPSILDYSADNFILTSSFSKTWAMTGFRVGYALSSTAVAQKILRINSLMITSIPEFVQIAAIAALDCTEVIRSNSQMIKERLEVACHQLAKTDSLEFTKPDGGMYIFPRIKGELVDTSKFALKLMNEKSVCVTPGIAFGAYPEHFRISLGQSKEVITEGIKRIGEILN